MFSSLFTSLSISYVYLTNTIFMKFRHTLGGLKEVPSHTSCLTTAARSFLPSRLSDSKSIHLMCITAYSSTYLKMTLDETATENSELVIKSMGGQVICSRLLMRDSWCIIPCQISWLLLVYHEACYVVVQCNTPGLLTPNMLAKIYDHEYRTRVPSTQSWLLRHHDWTSSYIVWEQMCIYQNIDATIVWVVRQSLLQHLWYLT